MFEVSHDNTEQMPYQQQLNNGLGVGLGNDMGVARLRRISAHYYRRRPISWLHHPEVACGVSEVKVYWMVYLVGPSQSIKQLIRLCVCPAGALLSVCGVCGGTAEGGIEIETVKLDIVPSLSSVARLHTESRIHNKLSCRREAARCLSLSLIISLSHSRSLKVIRNSTIP